MFQMHCRAVQVLIDQTTYGPVNNLINMAFFTLLVESAPPRALHRLLPYRVLSLNASGVAWLHPCAKEVVFSGRPQTAASPCRQGPAALDRQDLAPVPESAAQRLAPVARGVDVQLPLRAPPLPRPLPERRSTRVVRTPLLACVLCDACLQQHDPARHCPGAVPVQSAAGI